MSSEDKNEFRVLEEQAVKEALQVVKCTCYCGKPAVMMLEYKITFQGESGFSGSGGSRGWCKDHAKIASKALADIEELGLPK